MAAGLRRSRYAPLDPAVFADEESASPGADRIGDADDANGVGVANGPAAARSLSPSWINLGIWNGEGSGYAGACERMATLVGSMARLGPGVGERILDVGCGCGDSVELWRSEAGFGVTGPIVGLNVTESECAAARRRTSALADVTIVCADALDFAETPGQERFDAVVSVDALYHVDSRHAFLRAAQQRLLTAGGRLAAVDILGARDLLEGGSGGAAAAVDAASADAFERSAWTRLGAFARAPLRYSLLSLVSAAAGVPLVNLAYSRHSLAAVAFPGAAADAVTTVDVTANVFAPFARHMLRKAWTALRLRQWRRAATLVGSAGFMAFLGASGLVQCVMYSYEKPMNEAFQ